MPWEREELLQYQVDKVDVKRCSGLRGGRGRKRKRCVAVSPSNDQLSQYQASGTWLHHRTFGAPLCRTDLQRQPKIPSFLDWFLRTQSNTRRASSQSCVPSFSPSNHLLVNICTTTPFVDVSVSFLDPNMVWLCPHARLPEVNR